MSCLIIRRIGRTHCKRGPARCEQCRRMAAEPAPICLLDVCPPHPGEVQRRVIEVEVDGKTEWREFEIVRTFDNQEQARAYAQAEQITDVDV